MMRSTLVKLMPSSRSHLQILVAALALCVFVPASLFDPDPYHDGSQLPAAIVVRDGGVVHRDVFSAYGFLTAWIQGIALEAFGGGLATIRLLNAGLLVACSLLFLSILKELRIGVGTSALAVGSWILTWPGMSIVWGTALFPWPSVVFLLFQLSVALLYLRSGRIPNSWTLGLILGSFLGLAILARLNYGFFLLLALLVLEFGQRHKHDRRKFRLGWLVSLGAIGLGATAYLVVTSSVLDFAQQSVLGPLAGQATVSPTPWFYLENAYILGSAPYLAVLAIMAIASRRLGKNSMIALLCVLVGLLSLWASTGLPQSPIRTAILSRLTWAPALDGQTFQPAFVVAVLIIPVTAVMLVFSRRSNTDKSLLAVAVMATASLSQLVPVADPTHLWWALPLISAGVLAGVARVSGIQQAHVATILYLPALIFAPITLTNYLSEPRQKLDFSIAAGMYVPSSTYEDWVRLDGVLAGLGPDLTINCSDGLFSVWTGEFTSVDPGYVSYSYGVQGRGGATKARWVIDCLYADDPNFGSDRESTEAWKDSIRLGPLTLSEYSQPDVTLIRQES